MNAVLDYLASRQPWALRVAFWTLLIGGTAAGGIRAWEILRDEDKEDT
jgi:hypothetical protein